MCLELSIMRYLKLMIIFDFIIKPCSITLLYIIKGRKDAYSVGRFLQEAVIMKQVDHTNVLSMIGLSVHEDKPCVLLPYMSNGDLKLCQEAQSCKISYSLY